MRPLQLKLSGINSYREEQVIDFETLTSQGLFGIFGPTGSGKSSILDAMTLALYAKLPRDTKNFINTNEKTATVSFLFSITTDHTRKYLAERSFRYHTNRSTSTVRNTTGRLLVYDGETETVLADKPTEVTSECIRLLGLTSEDFMRTVVLPQGQFSEFLQLKNKERRIMLQRIFHLEKYGMELTGKIARARQKQDLLLSKLDGEKKAYEEISSKKLSELKQEEKAAKKQRKTLSKNLTNLEKSFQEADELYTLQQELLPLKEIEKENQIQLPSIKEKEAQLETARKAKQLRPFFIQLSNTKSSYEQTSQKLQMIQEEANTLNTLYEEIKKDYEQAATTQKKELPLLQTREQLLKTVQSIAITIQDWHRSQKTSEEALQEVTDTLTPCKNKLQEYLKQEQKLIQEISDSEKIIETTQISSEKKQLLEDGNILGETYREKHENYNKSSRSIALLKEEINKQEQTFATKKENLHTTYIQLCHRLSYLNEQHSVITAELDTLKEKKEQNRIQQKSWQQNHMAWLLREELEDGALCPVCGTPYEKHSVMSHTTNDTENISTITSEAEQKSEYSSISFSSLEKEQRNLEKQEQQQQQLLQQLDKELSSLNIHISTLKDALEITEENDRINTIKTDSVSSGPTAYISDSTTLPDYSSVSKQVAEYLQAKGDLNRQRNQYTRQSLDLKEQHGLLQKHAQKIFSLRNENSIDNFSAALKALRKKEQKRQEEEKNVKEKRQSLEKLRSEKESLSTQITALENKSASLLASIENCKKIITEQTAKIPETFSLNMNFTSELTNITKKQDIITSHLKKAEDSYQEVLTKLQKKREELGSCESAKASAYIHFEETQKLYLTQKEELGFSETEQPESYYIEEKQLTELQKEIDLYYNNVRQNTERIQYLQEKLNNRTIEENEWSKQKEALSTIKQQIKELDSTLLLLKHQIEEMAKELEKKKKLEELWKKEIQKKDRIRELEQLFKGNAFIEYVAQSKLSYIAKEASVILSKISGGNYALEINDSAEFIIRDNKNGGAVRPSDTLSGGEMFITSLSLALALSSSIQLNGAAPLEFFFLDEGFGSLDDDLLDTVMNSLEKLQSKRRSIGIISHVEAIQARVPVKLLVTPSDLSQKGSQITLEYS